jgi:hypothetical protein
VIAAGRVLLFGRRLFVGVTLAYLLAVVLLGGTAAARPVFYALVGAWGCFLIRWNGPGGKGVRLLELVGFNLALTLVLAELALRAFASYTGTSWIVSQALDGYRLQPGYDYGHGLRGNRLGYPGREFRLDKRPGVDRIAALGDSFAVAPAVPFAENYLTLLEHRLPQTEVYNFGVSGAGPREYSLILNQHILAFRPDLVLVSVFVGNDITEELATPRSLDLRQHALYLLLARGGRLLQERWRQSPGDPVSGSDRLTAGRLSAETFREVEARRLAVCLKDPPQGLEKKWARALAYLDRIIRECRRRELPVAFVLIPDEFQVNRAVLAEALRAGGLQADAVDLRLPQCRLLAFFAERGVPCLDLWAAFARVPETYAPRDTHWNIRGNRLAAEQLSHWLPTVWQRPDP